MGEGLLSPVTSAARSDWVRLRTLTLLRWLAVAGQTGAVVVAHLFLDLDLRLDLCGVVIATSAAFNIVSTVIHPENKRLSERDTALVLLYDLTQLLLLLGITGGLTNPFSVLILAPVTISATALTLRTTLLLGFVALAGITLLGTLYLPLRFQGGAELTLPPVYIAGMWAALAIGIAFLALYARRVAVEVFTMSQALVATQMALAREQRLTALGGLVAAAAHELGTPLATIKLVSTELARELRDDPELLEDVTLIRTQTDRCRDILRSLGRAGKEDIHLRHAPLSALVEEAAGPHSDRGKRLILRVGKRSGSVPQPEVWRLPELIHGLRNLIQNAVDFSQAHVWVDIDWDKGNIRVAVGDDGTGFPPEVLGRLGDPFLRHRAGTAAAETDRPGYEGMGLGLFIAKTLLERSGGRMTFANGTEFSAGGGLPAGSDPATARPPGAIVEIVWPAARISAGRDQTRGPLGENQPFSLTNI